MQGWLYAKFMMYENYEFTGDVKDRIFNLKVEVKSYQRTVF